MAYAKVFGSSESVLASQSKNITSADVVKADNGSGGSVDGSYCISTSASGVKAAVATVVAGGHQIVGVSVLSVPDANCPPDAVVRVTLVDPFASSSSSLVLDDGSFSLWLTD